jgi:ABC-type multidrug transport system permease subunit
MNYQKITRNFTVLLVAISSIRTITYARTAAGDINPPTSLSIPDFIQALTNIIPGIIVLIFLLMLIYGGFTRMTAGGDPEKEEQSNKILTAAVVGFLIIALSPIIINILGRFLGVDLIG